MKSALRRLVLRNQGQPPVPMSSFSNRFMTLNDNSFAMNGDGQMRAYGVMSTVYSCVQLIANSVSRVEWHLYRKQPSDARRRYSQTDTVSDQRTEVVKHQALSLIDKPNDFFTQSRLFELDATYLSLTGEYYWVLERANGLNFPTGIWSVRPDRMEPVPDPQNYIAGWIYTSPDGRTKIPLSTDEVIQVALPNPMDPMHGLGPVQSILVDVQSAQYSAEWNRNFFWNSAVPNGTITTPNNLNDDEFKQLMDRWRESHRGLSRSGHVGVLEAGQTFQATGMSMKDMDFANLRNLSRDMVREAFRMHKVMLGTSDDVNRANAQTGEEVFASWIIVPELDRKRDMLNNVFLPMFGSTAQDVEFDYTTPVPPNREEDRLEMLAKAQAALALVQAGYDPHDALEVVGLPDMDVAEKATQAPALPPAWVPAPPGQPALPPGDGAQAGPGQDTPADVTAQLVRRIQSDGYVPIEMEALNAVRR